MNIWDEDIKHHIWIVGVSGGCDSMALLAMCCEKGISVIAAHMNYQVRDTADRDMETVQKFCQDYAIPCEVSRQQETCTGNFQDFARKKRYAFYHNLIQKYHAEGVLIAHQLDDVLETYFMQKARHAIPAYYGIREKTEIMGCKVVRPLLCYTKQELRKYCEDHAVPFHDDESNFSRKYKRNRIRMDIIHSMNPAEKKQTLEEISQLNNGKEQFLERIQNWYAHWDGSMTKLKTISMEEQLAVLDLLIYEAVQVHTSEKERRHILSICGTDNFQRSIKTQYLQYSYGYLSMVKPAEDYSYNIEKVEYIRTPFFELRNHGKKIEGLTLQETDFPLTIRNVKKEDAIQLRFGKKRIHRWFIDRKIPMDQRKIWPVVENAQGNVIFVPKIGCDIAHFSNNPTLFVIK